MYEYFFKYGVNGSESLWLTSCLKDCRVNARATQLSVLHAMADDKHVSSRKGEAQ